MRDITEQFGLKQYSNRTVTIREGILPHHKNQGSSFSVVQAHTLFKHGGKTWEDSFAVSSIDFHNIPDIRKDFAKAIELRFEAFLKKIKGNTNTYCMLDFRKGVK